jgi:hypothetical protein
MEYILRGHKTNFNILYIWGTPEYRSHLHSEICGSLICATDLKVKYTKFRPKNSTSFDVRPDYIPNISIAE